MLLFVGCQWKVNACCAVLRRPCRFGWQKRTRSKHIETRNEPKEMER